MGHPPKTSQGWRGRAALASIVILIGLEGLATPPAGAATTVNIGSQFLGTTGAACPGSDQTTWLFVANQLDFGTAAGTLTATFSPSFTATVTGVPNGDGSNQHFTVTTPAGETLTGASAILSPQSGTPKLVLSGTCETSPVTTTTSSTTSAATTTTTATTGTTTGTTPTSVASGVIGIEQEVSPGTTTTVVPTATTASAAGQTQVLGTRISRQPLARTGGAHLQVLALGAALLLMAGSVLVYGARRRRGAGY